MFSSAKPKPLPKPKAEPTKEQAERDLKKQIGFFRSIYTSPQGIQVGGKTLLGE
jgi:hypothetical protein